MLGVPDEGGFFALLPLDVVLYQVLGWFSLLVWGSAVVGGFSKSPENVLQRFLEMTTFTSLPMEDSGALFPAPTSTPEM